MDDKIDFREVLVKCVHCGKEVYLFNDTHVCPNKPKKIFEFPSKTKVNTEPIPGVSVEPDKDHLIPDSVLTIRSSSGTDFSKVVNEKISQGYKVASTCCGIMQSPSGVSRQTWMCILVQPDSDLSNL